jgi:hypothetical protein
LGKKLDDKMISVLAGVDAGETIAVDPVQAAIFLKQHSMESTEAKHE